MYLSAISIGDAVPRVDFDAVVHSVFHSALNLRPAGKSELLTLVISSEADLPQGIRVDTPRDFSFEKFQMGEPAAFRGGNLRINSLTVQLHNARCWKCSLPFLEFDSASPAVSAAWGFVWNGLNTRQRFFESEIVANDLFRLGGSSQTRVSCKAGEVMRDLVRASCRCELTDTCAVKSLIGLGSGLTPSGDDLLAGYVAGLWCAVRGKNERKQFISDLGEAIIHHSGQTNDISRTYLYHASKGQVSSVMERLAEAICMGANLDRLLVIAENAMRVGHTSGMDAVTGLLVGLIGWEGDHPSAQISGQTSIDSFTR